jgi:hypothetical protein
MAYQSRRRNYLTRRERNARAWRTARILVIFTAIGLAVFAFMHRISLYNWLKTFFY